MTEKNIEAQLNQDKLYADGSQPSFIWNKIQKRQNVTLDDGRTLIAEDYLTIVRKPRVILISGDNDTPDLLKIITPVPDVIVHESTYTDDVLKQVNFPTQVTINSVNKWILQLKASQDVDGSIDDIKTTALSAIVFKRIGYMEEANKAITYLTENQDPKGCYPSTNCNVEDTSFALLALNEFSQDIIRIRNWLVDASNTFDIGTWELQVSSSKSESGNCYLNGNPFSISNGQGTESISTETFPLRIDCTELTGIVTTSFKHSYLGSVYEGLFTYQGNNFTMPLETSGCYGINYKEACDYKSTGYAIYALNKIGENPSQTSLTYPSESSTIEQSLKYLITKDSYALSWLLNNRRNAAWSTHPAYLNYPNDVYSTGLAALAIKDQDIYYSAAKEWAIDYVNGISNEAAAMASYALFLDQKVPVAVSVNPAVLIASKTDNTFKINLKNNYISKVHIMLEDNQLLSFNKKEFDLEDTGSFDVTVSIGNEVTSTLLTINYGTSQYQIPVIITPSGDLEDINLLPISKEAIHILDK